MPVCYIYAKRNKTAAWACGHSSAFLPLRRTHICEYEWKWEWDWMTARNHSRIHMAYLMYNMGNGKRVNARYE